MDLITAKKEAIRESKAQKGKVVYITVDGEGECDITLNPNKEAVAAYKGGSEISLPSAVKTVEAPTKRSKKQKTTKQESAANSEAATESPDSNNASEEKTNNKTMETKVKTSAKKATKTAAKKSAPAKKAPAKASANREPVKGKNKKLTAKEVLAFVKKGGRAYYQDGRPLPLGYLSKMKDLSREMEVTLVEAE